LLAQSHPTQFKKVKRVFEAGNPPQTPVLLFILYIAASNAQIEETSICKLENLPWCAFS
jgi:hypothetical protein